MHLIICYHISIYKVSTYLCEYILDSKEAKCETPKQTVLLTNSGNKLRVGTAIKSCIYLHVKSVHFPFDRTKLRYRSNDINSYHEYHDR